MVHWISCQLGAVRSRRTHDDTLRHHALVHQPPQGVAIEASRLARNGRDWHTLIEFCGLVGTLIVDEDGIYDPRHPNDRLLLGMKGTMSELELSMFRQRSQEALKQ